MKMIVMIMMMVVGCKEDNEDDGDGYDGSWL